MKEVTKEDLLQAFRDVEIKRGDTVYVASSLMALGLMKDPIGGVLWALKEAVGEEGTLAMPAFNFDFCDGKPFDREKSPAQVGVLAEAFRKMSGVHRTWSPPYHSVCAWGRKALEIAGRESLSSFGKDSVFQFLHDIDAKHLLIGCAYQQGVPHFHWLEELYNVPYRYWKKFEGEIILNGRSFHRAFFQYVRYRGDRLVTGDAEPLGATFEEAGHVTSTDVGFCRIRQFGLKAFKDFMGPRFTADPMVLLKEHQRAKFCRPRSGIERVHHIGIVSRYSDKIKNFLETIPLRLQFEGTVPGIGVNVQYFEGLNVTIEFVEPFREDSVVSGFLKKAFPSPLHHIAFEVADMDEALAYFKSKGYAPLDGRELIGPSPYQYGVYLMPTLTGGLLVELIANDGRHLPEYANKPEE